jgi:hypothetical protein
MVCMDCRAKKSPTFHFRRGTAFAWLNSLPHMVNSHRVCLMLLMIGSTLFLEAEKTSAAAVASPIEDITLDPAGTFFGCVADEHNEQRASGMMVRIYRDGKLIAQTPTDTQGAFTFPALQPGNHQLHWDRPDGVCNTRVLRLWNHDQAPPSSKNRIVLSAIPPKVVRGQYGNESPGGGSDSPQGMRRIFRNPWITAVIISTAVAIPIAVTHGGDDAS